jgi:hypothetical protein
MDVRPMDEVPPRTSSVRARSISSPVCSEPDTVWSISGIAPKVSQGSEVVTGNTWAAGTEVTSA